MEHSKEIRKKIKKETVNPRKIKETVEEKKNKFLLLKEKILKNANIFCDNLLEKLIAKEEEEKKFSTKLESIKQKVSEDKLKKAKEKRDRKASMLLNMFSKNKTIPKKMYSDVKLEETKVKVTKDENPINIDNSKNTKSIKNEITIDTNKISEDPNLTLVKNENIIATVKESKPLILNKNKINDRKKSRKERKEENLKLNLKLKNKILSDYDIAEKLRIKKKEKKERCYSKKRKDSKSKNIISEVNNVLNLKKYKIITSEINSKNEIIDSEPFIISAKAGELSKKIKYYHEGLLKKNENSYIGIFVYPENGENVVYELINSKYITINDKLTSRIAKQNESKRA